MRIFAWTDGKPGDGSFHYRLHAPLAEAAYQGRATVLIGPSLNDETLTSSDVVVSHRAAATGVSEWWRDLDRARLGRDAPLLVIEHDDNYLNVRSDNPTFAALDYAEYVGSGIERIRAAFDVADLITVSVPYLAEEYRRHTDTPIVVLPNTIDEVLLEVPPPLRRPGERLRVGWAGGGTHTLDWRTCAAGIRCGLVDADADFFMMGADFRELLGYRYTEFVPWAHSIDRYYLPLTSWHVMLAPLADEEWNRSKSPLKALEAAALGIPTVAGDVEPYRQFVIDGETGFLCRTDEDWAGAIRALGGDEEMRREMGRRARQEAARYTTQEWAPRWVETYRSALAAKHDRIGAA